MKKITNLLSVILVFAFLLSLVSVFASGDSEIPSQNTAETSSSGKTVNDALVLKVGSNGALLRGNKIYISSDSDGNHYGAPYSDSGTVMVPLRVVLSYTDFEYSGSDAEGFNINVLGNIISLIPGNSVTEGVIIPLTFSPTLKSFGDDNVMYIALDDVEKIFVCYYVTYDESGMIFISNSDNIVDRSVDSDEQLIKDTAKRFIFADIDFRELKNASGQKLVADYRSKPIKDMATFVDSFSELDEFKKLYDMFKDGTNNFEHPYILTSQEKFDELHFTYLSTSGKEDDEYASYYDTELKWYINTQILYANGYMEKYASFGEDGAYEGLKDGHWVYDSEGKANTGSGWSTEVVEGVTNHSVAIMPYQGPEYDRNPLTGKGYGQGYDPAGGRLNVLSDGESALVGALEPCALAYQITRDENYLRFAYDWMVALCSWEHWGPGHYLNCTNTARPLATAYDWLYNDFVRVYGQKAVDDLAKRIYENAVHEAIVTLTGNPAEHYRYGDSSRYWAHVGNWNSCGASGMLIASLAVMGNEEWGDDYREECLFVIAASLGHYMERGLTYITLDGGYRESAGYWGAVRFMHTIHKVLLDTTGTDFGLMDYPGMDTADYFGCMMEGPDYKRWNYHDDWEGTQSSDWFYLSAELYDRPDYAGIRYEQLHSGNANKAPHRYDVLFYDKDTINRVDEVELPLDYSMTSIDATVVRDSWEKNSLFAGIMGGYNNVAHGQYDSGNWIYENKGIRWFVDLGADNYNLYGGGLAKGYYKYSAEGNNTLALGSLPHGQLMDSTMNADTMGGQLISFESNEFGASTVIDQKSVYGDAVEYAYRGMLLTNDRRTFVIQDEIKTTSAETIWWFAHYKLTTVIKIELSEDGRVAYMWAPNSDGEFMKLRVSLISDNKDLKFEIMDTYTYVLDGTPPLGYSETNKPGIKEENRDKFAKLAVKAENVTELNMAVVIEIVNGENDQALGYRELVPMEDWEIKDGENESYEQRPVYTVYYNDGTCEDFYTSRLAEGVLKNPSDTSTHITTSTNTKSNIVRIECHGNVTVDTNINMNLGEHWTINLNGNLVYQSRTIRNGYSTVQPLGGSLTINNGMWYSTSQFQVRFGTTFILNNVDFETTSFAIRDEGAKIIIKDSTVSADLSFINIVNIVDLSDASGHDLIVSNSDIKVGEYFISFTEGSDTKQNYHNVYITDGSRISLPRYVSDPENPLTEAEYYSDRLLHNGRGSKKIIHNFILEDGVKFDFDFTIPENESNDEIDRRYSLTLRRGMSLSDDGALSLGKLSFAEGVFGYEGYPSEITLSDDGDYPYVVKEIYKTIYYKVTLSDGTSLNYFRNELSDALPTSNVDNGVREIKLLEKSFLTKEAKLGNSQSLVIDLNGLTLTISGRITMGSSVSSPISCNVKIKNGTLLRTGGDGFCARMGTKLVFEDLTVTVSASYLLWDNGASEIVFDNCIVNTNHYLVYSRIFFKEKDTVTRNVFFIDSEVNVLGSLFYYSECTADKEERDVYVLENSILTYGRVFAYDTNHVPEIGRENYRFYIEKDALISSSGLGLPEETETVKYEIFGYDYVTLNEKYEIVSSKQYSNFTFIPSGEYFTVEYLTFVVGIKSSLTLYSDFTINFFIPIVDNKIDKIVIDGKDYLINENTEIFTDNGVSYYKVVIRSVAPHEAADDIEMIFCSGDFTEEKTFSVIEYCRRILRDDLYSDTHKLAASVVDYVNEAYEYTDSEKPQALIEILLSENYLKSRPEPMPHDVTTTDKGSAGIAVKSAQLELGGSLNFKFNIQSQFTGTVIINGQTFKIENGYCDGADSIYFAVRAYDMYDPEKVVIITGISADGEEFGGTYDLRAYINNSDKKNVRLARLLSALYTYCTEAYSYKYGIEVERPDIGSLPEVDVEFFG